MASLETLKLGADTGGTFTDFILQIGDELKRYKCPSTPADPSGAILQGVRYFFPDGAPENLEIIHGTTVGTNAFLERKGGRSLLITTKGFEDILALGRQNRASLFDLEVTRPAAIIPDDLIVGITERIDASGEVIVPLVEAEVLRLEVLLKSHDIDTVVVCFLHSFLNETHERLVHDLLTTLAVPVLCSVDILPEFREFERCSTALVNGYLSPIMSAYIDKLVLRLEGRLLSVQQSNGGIMAAEAVKMRAAHTLLSGPAAGVQGAWQLSGLKGQGQIITFDMGGTSTDVALCDGGLSHTKEYILDGYPISIPMLDIHTVGAGGGSIAYIDPAGVLQVGPRSAGADPGPVCYGRGNDITVTDANLLLGRLLPHAFLAGRMGLDVERTSRSMQEMAELLHLSVAQLSLGIISIVNAGMVKAVRTVSLDRGYDPADFILYSFGGSSGLHCCELADELGITTIEIPARAGVLSAQGLVFAPPLFDQTQALFLQGEACSYENVQEYTVKLEKKVKKELLKMVSDDQIICESFVDLRYAGQSYEIAIPVNAAMEEQFHARHKQMFGYDLDERILECVSIRSVARKGQGGGMLPAWMVEESLTDTEMVSVIFPHEQQDIPVYSRNCISGQRMIGPCLIIDDYTTILVTSSFSFEVDRYGSLTLQKEENR